MWKNLEIFHAQESQKTDRYPKFCVYEISRMYLPFLLRSPTPLSRFKDFILKSIDTCNLMEL